jgi:hypothetical protein
MIGLPRPKRKQGTDGGQKSDHAHDGMAVVHATLARRFRLLSRHREQALSTGCSCRPTARAELAKFAADKRGF